MERIDEDAGEEAKTTELEGKDPGGDEEEKQLQEIASSLVASVRSQQRVEAPQNDCDLNESDIEDINYGHGLTSPVKPLVQRTRKLLFRRLRVSVVDGRVFVGKFHCLDKQGNIILFDTVEFRQTSPDGGTAAATNESLGSASDVYGTTEQRNLGLVLIPAQHRTSLFVEASLPEQFSILSLQSNKKVPP